MQNLFIIGAARSGTNVLRNVITSFDDMETWPCDEIDLVFRYGNRSKSDDRFTENQINDKSKTYIKSFFSSFQSLHPHATIVEKTCANSLRVPFLNSIFPNAKYIFIIRDGYDVVASAKKRWTSSVDITYLLKKLKFVPKFNIPYYLFMFIKNRFSQLTSSNNIMPKWGPVYPGLIDDIKNLSLDEVCALQWKNSVESAYNDLLEVGSEKSLFITYENLINNTVKVLNEIQNFLGNEWREDEIYTAASLVRKDKIGKGFESYKNDIKIKKMIDPVMSSIYEPVAKSI